MGEGRGEGEVTSKSEIIFARALRGQRLPRSRIQELLDGWLMDGVAISSRRWHLEDLGSSGRNRTDRELPGAGGMTIEEDNETKSFFRVEVACLSGRCGVGAGDWLSLDEIPAERASCAGLNGPPTGRQIRGQRRWRTARGSALTIPQQYPAVGCGSSRWPHAFRRDADRCAN